MATGTNMRFEEFQHTATIETGLSDAPLVVNDNDDVQGQDRWLYGVRTEEGADLQRIKLTSDAWGRRELSFPPVGTLGDIAGTRIRKFPFLEHVQENQIVRSAAAQNGAGPEQVSFTCLYIFGRLPAAMIPMVKPQHVQYARGTASNGIFPDSDNPSAQFKMLRESFDQLWLPLQATAISIDNASDILDMKIRHPRDQGGGPPVAGQPDVLQENAWQVLPPLEMIAGNDTVDELVRDDAAGDFDAYIHFVDAAAAPIPMEEMIPRP